MRDVLALCMVDLRESKSDLSYGVELRNWVLKEESPSKGGVR